MDTEKITLENILPFLQYNKCEICERICNLNECNICLELYCIKCTTNILKNGLCDFCSKNEYV